MSAVTDDVLLVRQQTQVSALPQFVSEDKIKVTSPNINAQSLSTKAQGSCYLFLQNGNHIYAVDVWVFRRRKGLKFSTGTINPLFL